MNPGTIVVIVVLAVIIFFAGRATIREFKNELTGKGCAGCSGSCSGSSCSSCKVSKEDLEKAKAWHEQYQKDHRI
ncbi:MAG: hypothetical protein K5745_02995 [Saccharofermentans sp.]|nr:hypothetical protein [Saccharofermentans sp.]